MDAPELPRYRLRNSTATYEVLPQKPGDLMVTLRYVDGLRPWLIGEVETVHPDIFKANYEVAK